MTQDGKVNILVVDDSPEKVLAVEASLADLGENLMRAYSGRDALRCLLQHEVAVILLDVNMPGMDGFETAAMIRQRQATRDIPIIFITVSDDQTHVSRGYSLGAVDYIHSPVVSEVLRTKVSVFVDVFKKTQQITQQAEWLRQLATQLHRLTAASLAINSALSVAKMLQVVAEAAREITTALQSHVALVKEQNWTKAQTASWPAQESSGTLISNRQFSPGLREWVCRTNKPIRLTTHELEEHPLWISSRHSDSEKSNGRAHSSTPRGWLAAPLTSRDGRNLGLIEVTQREEGEFTGDDEAILVQLAQLASIAIENADYAQEREANRIKDEFLSTLSHELRTPLNSILGWTQLLRLENLSEEMAHGVEVIERSARAQAKLVEDMLDLSRVTTGKLSLNIVPLSMKATVEAAVEALRPAAEDKQIRLECSTQITEDTFSGDADRLQQVVWNLLSNAIKFTPSGGRVQVRLERQGTDLRIQVIDDGEGISPAFLPFVFDRFRQADSTSTRRQTGLGIGLAVVRHIVELHCGDVEARSEGQGRGATFTVTLHGAVAQSPDSEVAARMKPASRIRPAQPWVPDLKDLRILIVDDETDARHTIGRLLSKHGAEVKLAGSASEAMSVLGSWCPDILVSDIAMPGEDGYDLIRRVRNMPPADGGAVPAIALTAYAREEDRVRAQSAGFETHLCKPVDSGDLTATIRRLAGRATSVLPPSDLAALTD